MSLCRYLDGFESLVVGDGEPAIVEYQGDIDEPSLNKAMQLLGHIYPLLRARIRSDSNGFLLYVPDDGRVRFEIADGDEATVQREAKRQWDPEAGVAQFTLIRRKGGGALVMRLDHSVGDGPSRMAMLSRLWSLYTSIVGGDEISVEYASSLPRSHDDVLEKRFCDWEFFGSSENTTHEGIVTYDVVQRRILLDENDTENLLGTSSRQDIKIHGLICGAVLVAQRDVIARLCQELSTTSASMACMSPVNLRTRAEPPIDPTETTNLQVTHQARIDILPESDPMRVGADVSAQLHRSLSAKKLSLPMLQVRHHEDESPQRILLNAAVTNLLNLPNFEHPPGLNFLPYRHLVFRAPRFPAYGTWRSENTFTIMAFFPAKFFNNALVEQITYRVAENLRRYGVGNPKIFDDSGEIEGQSNREYILGVR